VTSTPELNDEAQNACRQHISKTAEFLAQIADKDGARDRSGPLALLELEKRAVAHGLSTGTPAEEIVSTPDQPAIKTLTLSTLWPSRISNVSETRHAASRTSSHTFTSLGSTCPNGLCILANTTRPCVVYFEPCPECLNQASSLFQASLEELRRTINALKLLRFNLTGDQLTPKLETSLAAEYVRLYLEGLAHGRNLPDTELQPADDLAVLAGHAFVNLWKMTRDLSFLHQAVVILEFASSKSKQAYIIRLMLIRIYQLLGAYST
jgi:N-terminal acetyltransferase B complex non-catalytic subunit